MLGWGGWGDVNVHVHLHHEVDATSRQGWGEVGGVMLTFMCTCIMKLMLRHVRVGGGVGGVMLTFMCTCMMKLMLRHVRVGGGVGAVMSRFYRSNLNNKCRSFPPALPLHTYTRILAHNMTTDDVCSLPAVSTVGPQSKLRERNVQIESGSLWHTWLPKEFRNKQKFTRDVNQTIRDFVFAFVCRTNWGNASTLKNLADLASKKKRVRNACTTIWWWYPIELRINGLRVAQIPSKRPNPILYTNQKCCKGWEFHGCLGLQTSKISGTVVPSWPCCCCCCCWWWWWCCCCCSCAQDQPSTPATTLFFPPI